VLFSWITLSAPAESFVIPTLIPAGVLVLHGKQLVIHQWMNKTDLYTALRLVKSARRSSRSSMVSPSARRVFFCKFAMPTPLLRRISSVSLQNAVNSEPTNITLARMAPPLTSLLSHLQSYHLLVLEPLKLLATFRLPGLVVPGSGSIQATGEFLCPLRMIVVLTMQPVLLAQFPSSRTLIDR
jgi:hypothetical protein